MNNTNSTLETGQGKWNVFLPCEKENLGIAAATSTFYFETGRKKKLFIGLFSMLNGYKTVFSSPVVPALRRSRYQAPPKCLGSAATRAIFGLLCVFVFKATSAQTQMSDTEASDLRSKVKALAGTTHTVTADFVQKKHLDFLSNAIESKGKLSFKNPNLVKWEYVSPFSYSVLFENDMLYIDNEGDKTTVDIGSNKLFKKLNELIRASVTGNLFNTQEFDISYVKFGSDSEVQFVPKDQKFAKYIKEFHFTFNSDAEVREVKMIEPSNDYTHIVFSNRTTNQNLPDAVFAH